MPEPTLTDRLAGMSLVAVTVLMALADWTRLPGAADAAAALCVVVLALLTPKVRPSRQVFVMIALVLAAIAAMTRGDALGLIDRALQTAAFVAAFFTALTTLRHAADGSPSIQACGTYLATQPPGRRYMSLTIGGQLFSLILNYGAISLLGSLALAGSRHEVQPEIVAIRTRRMLLAIQRGFVSTLPWSPLAFSTAITTVLVPGASWTDALLPCLVSGVILAALGWALDTVFKPKLPGPRPPPLPPVGHWTSLRPLVVLLAILITGVAALHAATQVRVVGIVVVLVPLIAAVWVLQQQGRAGLRAPAASYVSGDLIGYRNELVLLMMAGFIGTVGAALAVPLVAASGLDLAAVPAPLLLIGLVWIVPLTGQLGMNPILSVSILAPMLPDAAALGVSPAVIVTAITSGWALTAASSPFTATTLMVGSFGGVSAKRVGLVWNGAYTLIAGVLLSAWILVLSIL